MPSSSSSFGMYFISWEISWFVLHIMGIITEKERKEREREREREKGEAKKKATLISSSSSSAAASSSFLSNWNPEKPVTIRAGERGWKEGREREREREKRRAPPLYLLFAGREGGDRRWGRVAVVTSRINMIARDLVLPSRRVYRVVRVRSQLCPKVAFSYLLSPLKILTKVTPPSEISSFFFQISSLLFCKFSNMKRVKICQSNSTLRNIIFKFYRYYFINIKICSVSKISQSNSTLGNIIIIIFKILSLLFCEL